jgi:hypothetical protein
MIKMVGKQFSSQLPRIGVVCISLKNAFFKPIRAKSPYLHLVFGPPFTPQTPLSTSNQWYPQSKADGIVGFGGMILFSHSSQVKKQFTV